MIQINDDILIKDNETTSEYANSQWKIINEISNKKKDKKINHSVNVYGDNSWYKDKNNTGEQTLSITFDTYLNENAMAIFVLKEIIEFKLDKNTFSTAISEMTVIRLLLKRIVEDNILRGEEGGVVTGLNAITTVQMAAYVDYLVFNDTLSIDTIRIKAVSLTNFVDFLRNKLKYIPFLNFKAKLPWEQLGIPSLQWVKQRASDLNYHFSETTGNEALPPSVYIPLIKTAKKFIDFEFQNKEHDSENNYELSNFIIDCQKLRPSKLTANGLSTAHTPQSLFNIQTNNNPFRFDDLRKVEFTTDKTRKFQLSSGEYTEYKIYGYLSGTWIRDIERDLILSCYVIILMTSGLRIRDLTNLEVGCCISSGSIKSLYYLTVRRLNKTGNFIHIPVPENTYKAILILTRLKQTDNKYLFDHQGAGANETKSFYWWFVWHITAVPLTLTA